MDYSIYFSSEELIKWLYIKEPNLHTKYINNLIAAHIDGHSFLTLNTNNKLKEISIDIIGHRLRIIRRVNKTKRKLNIIN